jgi:hypothetical protein
MLETPRYMELNPRVPEWMSDSQELERVSARVCAAAPKEHWAWWFRARSFLQIDGIILDYGSPGFVAADCYRRAADLLYVGGDHVGEDRNLTKAYSLYLRRAAQVAFRARLAQDGKLRICARLPARMAALLFSLCLGCVSGYVRLWSGSFSTFRLRCQHWCYTSLRQSCTEEEIQLYYVDVNPSCPWLLRVQEWYADEWNWWLVEMLCPVVPLAASVCFVSWLVRSMLGGGVAVDVALVVLLFTWHRRNYHA